MTVQPINPAVETQAKRLAADNRQAEPDITRILWFPHEQEVRLIEVTEQIPVTDDGQVHPYYFGASPNYDLPLPSAIAMIREDEVEKLKLPDEWGNWADAVEL